MDNLFDKNDSKTTQRFLGCYVQNQRRIYGYILSVVSSWSDAEDILQDTTALMWEKFDEFEDGTCFSGWGIQIAKYKILEFRRKNRKHTDLSEDVFEKLTDHTESYRDKFDSAQKALEYCLKKLSVSDYELIQMRYTQNNTIKDIALHMGRSVQGLYKVMARIHTNLAVCVRRSTRMEEL